MNDVRLYGRIAKDLPNIEELTNKPLLLILAVDKFIAGEKDVDFIPIKVWGKLAKNICEYKAKGDELIVLGRLGVGKYEKDGQKMFVLEVTATSVEFIGSRRKDITQKEIDEANAASYDLEKESIEMNSTNLNSVNKENVDSSPNLKENNLKNNSNEFEFNSSDDEEFFKDLMNDFNFSFTE